MLAFCSIAVLLVGAAWLFVLPPLLRRDGAATAPGDTSTLALAVHREQLAELNAALARGELSASDHGAERAQLEQRVLEDLPPATGPAAATRSMRGAVVVALAVPLVSLGVYGLLGRPGAISPAAEPMAAAASGPHQLTQEQMEAMVQRLAERLKARPDDADGWHMLARSYVSFGRYAEAAAAYDRAVTLNPRDVQVLTDYADTLAMVNGRNLEGRPAELVSAALKLAPAHPKALALAGTAAFNRRDFAAAIAHWQGLLAVLPAGSDGAQRAASSIAQAQAAQAQAGGPGPLAGPAAAAHPASISGRVELSDALRTRLAPGATLFVFARAATGPRMPLAALRAPVAALPMPFVLDDSQAMSSQWRLSGQREVTLGARISMAGSATPQSGDLVGTLGPLGVGATNVVLRIDGVVP